LRSKEKRCPGSASTGLAAKTYKNFNITHSLLTFSLIEEEDRDKETANECHLT